MKAKNYYEILGVSKNASDDQIQRAYRKLARKYHPDVSKDKDADKKFKELNEAREVLKDPEKRKLYDTYGANWQQGKDRPRSQQGYGGYAASGSSKYSQSFRFAGNDFSETADFNEILENLFRQGAGEHTGYADRSFDSSGEATEAKITVTLSEVFHGANRTLTLQSYEFGSDGKLHPVNRTLQVKIPKGITDGAVIRLAGQGGQGSGRGKAGDLLLCIRIAADSRFKADGHDLYTVVAVSPWEVILGAAIPVQTMDGTVTLSVPRGSQNGRKLRLRGKGLPKRNGSTGDIIVELEVRIPDEITSEEERLCMEMAKISKFDPRSKKAQRAGSQVTR
ncbi:MAG: DnaJ domain-containing protein [Proteobacteria bacterium]|nr:DnaJ domain-containing protein [Pseudomonadota bacterium]